MTFFHPLLVFLIHLGYFGPLVMGILDSSFLVLPFGNDLLVVWMVARQHHGAPWFVLSAAIGSTVGAWLLALVARKLGKQGICKLAGERQFKRLQRHLGHRTALVVALGALAPPPFPYTLVIAAASALGNSLPEILLANFVTRLIRFAILAYLAMRFGPAVMRVIESAPFRYTMFVFIGVCLVASIISIVRWVRHAREERKTRGMPAMAHS